MIEVMFGESEAGSMKAAKCTVVGHTVTTKTINTSDGPTSVWISRKNKSQRKMPSEEGFAGWIPGTSEEVVCLGFLLDVGDIREPVDSRYRRELVGSLYEMADICDTYVNELARLKKYLEDGENIRIWYSDAPYSRCGFYHLCKMLQDYENTVRVVKLPEYSVRTSSIVFHNSWGNVPAEEFSAFLPYEKCLSKEELRMYAMLWSDLVEDNSPLRAMANGRLVGVPEDFYDFLIWKRLTGEPVRQARLIGDILGYYQLNVGDWWYAKRIEHYIKQGRINVVEDSEDKYKRMICLGV